MKILRMAIKKKRKKAPRVKRADLYRIDLSKRVDTVGRMHMVYGDTGMNKTGSLITLPECAFPVYIFDFDKGTSWLQEEYEVGDFTGIAPPIDSGEGYEIMKEELLIMGENGGQDTPFKTIIFDSFTALYSSIIYYCQQLEGKGDLDDPLYTPTKRT